MFAVELILFLSQFPRTREIINYKFFFMEHPVALGWEILLGKQWYRGGGFIFNSMRDMAERMCRERIVLDKDRVQPSNRLIIVFEHSTRTMCSKLL